MEMKRGGSGLVYPAFKKAFPGLLIPLDDEVDTGHGLSQFLIQI
jgi:hypothetical protein